jgi:hypothetical protein
VDDYFVGLVEQQGFIARAEVLAAGLDDRFVRHQLRRRAWTRIRNGAYCLTPVWSQLDAVARHERLARAVLRAHGDAVALSHVSGMVIRGGCDLWGVDLSRVHVTRRDNRSGSRERDVVHHQGALGDGDVEEVEGLLVLKEARCLAETASAAGVEPGVCVVDSALHRGRVSQAELDQCRNHMRRHPGSRTLDMVLRLADGRSESVGESRSRYLFWRQGLPSPVPQYAVHDHSGHLIGIVDLALPEHRVLFEFDGRVKYGRLLPPGQDAAEAVYREKLREDALREATGFTVVRATWANLAEPIATAERVRRAMAVHSAA